MDYHYSQENHRTADFLFACKITEMLRVYNIGISCILNNIALTLFDNNHLIN